MKNILTAILFVLFSLHSSTQVKRNFSFTTDDGKRVTGNFNYIINRDTLTIIVDSSGIKSIEFDTLPNRLVFFRNGILRNFVVDSASIASSSSIHVQFKVETITLPEIRYNYDKPAIYLYSDDDIDLTIELPTSIDLGFCNPRCQDRWKVSIKNQRLEVDSQPYPYLFWEGQGAIPSSAINWRSGFCVSRSDLIPFFEISLHKFGLNDKEAQDFIAYWCPRLIENEYNYIHFMDESLYNELAPITCQPIAQSQLRLFMITAKLDSPIQLIPQEIKSFVRKGFTLIEWGGTEASYIPGIF